MGRLARFCGCSSAGRARPRHGRGHEFETRHPLHFGCVLSLRGRVTWCWRPGMCASLGQLRAARHHIRRDARVWAQPKWIHSPLKGHRIRRVRLAGSGHRDFSPVTRVRIPHATPITKPHCLVDSAARVPACLAGSRGFDSRTRRQRRYLVSSDGQKSVGLRSRRSHVRVVHEVPTTGAWQIGSRFQSRCSADGSARDLGSRGRRFETCHRDQTRLRLGVAVAQWQSRGP
jgi:hypothetical protein